MPPPPILPLIPNNLPFLTYIEHLARTNNITSLPLMSKFLENVQKELYPSNIESKRILPLPPPLTSRTIHHHQQHPYFSQIFLDNSFLNHFSSPTSLAHFGHSPSNGFNDQSTFPYHFSTPKKRRTKVVNSLFSLFCLN